MVSAIGWPGTWVPLRVGHGFRFFEEELEKITSTQGRKKNREQSSQDLPMPISLCPRRNVQEANIPLTPTSFSKNLRNHVPGMVFSRAPDDCYRADIPRAWHAPPPVLQALLEESIGVFSPWTAVVLAKRVCIQARSSI